MTEDFLASQWASWMACGSDVLPTQIRSDLASTALDEDGLVPIVEFVREYQRHGTDWSARGLRGDQLRTPMLRLQENAPVLFKFICGKIVLAEKNKWVGGSLDDEVIASQTKYQKFVIASTPRAGTHLLRTLLGSHPCIEVHGEAFNRFGQHLLPYAVHDTPIDTILSKHLFRPYFEYVGAVGFMLFRDLDTEWGGENVWAALTKMRDLKIILLDRRSRLEQLVSLKKSLRDHIWYVGKDDKRSLTQEKVMIPCNEFMDFIDRDVQNRSQFCAHFHGHEILPVAYEDLLAMSGSLVSKLLDFLGVSDVPLQPGTGKKERRPMNSVVSNIEELRSSLSGTKYETYI